MAVDKARIEGLIRELLVEIGEDPDREGLQRTPRRVAAALRVPDVGLPRRPAG